jgi:hypothetical protein
VDAEQDGAVVTTSTTSSAGPAVRASGVLHLRPELEHRLGVHLADARLGDAQAEPVAALGADREQLVEGDHRHERDLVEDLVRLVGRDAELLGDLGVGGAAMQAVLQGDVGLLDLAGLNRTDRGIQSIARSSSMIAPLIREIAYVSNLTPCSRSYFSIASIRPKMP